MEVHRPGTCVTLDDDIRATIIAATILDEDVVQYQCVWWNGKTRTKDWIKPVEITVTDRKHKKIKIGFSQEGSSQ